MHCITLSRLCKVPLHTRENWLGFEAQWLLHTQADLILKRLFILVTECIFVFGVIFHTNSNWMYYPKHYYINRMFFVFECVWYEVGTQFL